MRRRALEAIQTLLVAAQDRAVELASEVEEVDDGEWLIDLTIFLARLDKLLVDLEDLIEDV